MFKGIIIVHGLPFIHFLSYSIDDLNAYISRSYVSFYGKVSIIRVRVEHNCILPIYVANPCFDINNEVVAGVGIWYRTRIGAEQYNTYGIITVQVISAPCFRYRTYYCLPVAQPLIAG